jgi:carbonic anhydrase/acetyltransferase-like protein (isoleucine patch superfamily)
MLIEVNGHKPQVGQSAFIAPSATLIGDVNVEKNASVWYGAVIRGDNDKILIGESSNIQDGAILHTDKGFVLKVADHVTVGHRAVLHGCEVGSYSLIGIGAILLNGVKVGKDCIIGAGALLTEGTEIPDGSLVVGSPGRIIRTVKDDEKAKLKQSAESYAAKAQIYKSLK